MSERRRGLHLDPEDRRQTANVSRKPPRASGKRPAGKPRSANNTWQRRLGLAALRWSLVVGIWGAIAMGAVFGYFALTLPETGDLPSAERRPSITLVSSDGALLATYGDLFGDPVSLREMPKYLPDAVIATEDRRFYSHFGVDLFGLIRAVFINLRAGHVVQGGSTISQQLAKNLFLTPERTVGRKIQEMELALWLEHKFTKDQLLEIYLNRVYLGAGTYGVDAAAHRYFGKSARQVTLYESAIIAGLLKAPTKFSPARDRERAAQRAEQVLANMVDAGFLTPDQASTAAKQSVRLADVTSSRSNNHYFADWIVEQLADFGGIANQDLTVVTTLDAHLQGAAEAAVAETLMRDGPKAGASQAALVAITPDGAVRAMVGGRDYGGSQFNRATQAMRQPGSAFKPFVYLAGLEAGLKPSDHFVDGPISFGKWQPRNYTNRYLGDITVADAFAQSINTVAVQVEMRVGVPHVIAAAHRLGITADLGNDASLALGTSEVTLLELTGAYGVFANGGMGVWPHGIAEIRDRNGKVLFQRGGSGLGRAIAPDIAAEMTELMSGVMTRGTGKAAALDRPAAGKTGTTQDSRDALFVGFTADLVAGVWFGNDDNSPMNKVTGGTLPAQTWKSFMRGVSTGPARPLPSASPAPLTLPPATGSSGPAIARGPGWLESLFGGGSGERSRTTVARENPVWIPPRGETR
jgi:penicillin-binding protein 1A